LEGVEVVIDGRSAGTSGANGIVFVKARDKPEKVELRREGWEVVGELDLRSASKRGWNRFNTVRMQPAPKQKP
jgi:hypothetical protein